MLFISTASRRLLNVHLVYDLRFTCKFSRITVKIVSLKICSECYKMLRLSFPGAYKILNVQSILTGRTSVKNIHITLSKSFQIAQSSQELDNREGNVVDTLYNGLLSSNRACLAKSITLTESTHPRKRLQARSLLKKALQHCKQCQQNNNSFSFRIGN